MKKIDVKDFTYYEDINYKHEFKLKIRFIDRLKFLIKGSKAVFSINLHQLLKQGGNK